jgi:3',5'-cyclic-AMP phosphodiesterase
LNAFTTVAPPEPLEWAQTNANRLKHLKKLTKYPISLLQLTDQHLFGDATRGLRGVPTLPALRDTLAVARADIDRCAAILATGDLVQDDPGGYVHFRREFAALGKPILCIPGNHDDVPAMRAALADPPFQMGGVFDVGNWRVVLLDSTVPGETGGELGPQSLQELQGALEGGTDRHTLICLHHHPVSMRSRWLDTVGLANADAFFEIVRPHRQVRAIAFGHVHQAFDELRDGVRLIATPSTCSQFLPGSDDFAVDNQPPAYRKLALHADGRIDTEVVWLRQRADSTP